MPPVLLDILNTRFITGEEMSMHPVITDKIEEIHRLCECYQVKRLEVFGSAVNGKFDPETSDLDFLVEYKDLEPGEHAQAYFGLVEGLESLFGRDVDLVMTSAIKNKYFLEAIQPWRTELYAN